MVSFFDLVKNRRSIRKYQPQAVEAAKIKRITAAALMSPAGKRLNPWEFVVVEDRDILRRMAACRTYGSQLLENSPLGIVVCADKEKSDTWLLDCAIASIIMQLEAADLGLGSCWVQVYGREKDEQQTAEEYVRSLLDIPDHYAVLNIISIGYKDEDRRPYDEEKLSYEKVHYGKFGNNSKL